MPTGLPKRKSTKRVSIKAKIIICICAILAVMLVKSFAAHADMFDYRHQHYFPVPPLAAKIDKPSYYGYGHALYHDLFYSKLKKFNGGSCCSGHECRVTEPLIDAPPEFKSEGYDKMVMVQGEWYPIKLLDKMTGFTADQVAEAKKSPLYQEFLQQTHVCASPSVSNQTLFAGQSRHSFLVMVSSYIYCVVDGGVKG